MERPDAPGLATESQAGLRYELADNTLLQHSSKQTSKPVRRAGLLCATTGREQMLQ